MAFAAGLVSAQQQANVNRGTAGASTPADGPNLSVEKLGPDDLVGISVYDAPELTHSVRVDADGNIRLPMVRRRIHAAGLLPAKLEGAIAAALIDEHILVDPVVTVSVVEYHSRPITVVGAVKNPMTFQAAGTVTLLDAITRAGGITDNAGSVIMLSHSASGADSASIPLIDRIPVHSLMDATDSAANLKLEGGEVIRVPEAGQVFVVGNVKRPGSFPIVNDSESSILKMLALAGGLDNFTSHTAYIYRIDGASGHKNEIPVEIKKIQARKSPDVPLYGNDMLYVPTATGQRASFKTLEIALGAGVAVGTILIYVFR